MEHPVAHAVPHTSGACTESDVQQCVVCSGRGRLALEEVRDARVRCEAEHMLRCVREGRGPEELSELCVERGEDVEEREERLRVIEREGLQEFSLSGAVIRQSR